VRARRVLRKFVRVAPVLNLHVGGRIIGTTAEHPFFVEGKGWTPAFDLTIGDRVLLEDGQYLGVEGVADSGRVETVYNIEVEGDHTYFVGEQTWGWAVWSHNSSCPDEDILRLSNQGVQNAARNKNLFGSQIHHIATDKGASEANRWREVFEFLFSGARMTLQDGMNKTRSAHEKLPCFLGNFMNLCEITRRFLIDAL